MNLTIEQVKKYNINKIFNVIKTSTDKLYEKYDFAEIQKEEFDKLVM